MSPNSAPFNYNHALLAGVVLASAGLFIIDLQFPLGIAGGIPYALLVMATYWIKQRRYTVAAGILSTVLIIVGFFFSEPSGYVLISTINRVMATFVIWGSVWFVIKYKNSLNEIKKSENRMSALFEAATEGIIISDLNGEIVTVNKKAEELFGYHRDELVGEKVEVLVPPQYKSKHKHFRYSYYDDPQPRPMGQERDLYGLRKDGTEFPVEISLNHFENEEGRFVISYVIDISQRKKAELQLLENERLYRMLFQGTTDEILVFQVDDDMEPLPFLEVNDIACEILGYSREELLQKTIYEVVGADDEEVRKRVANVISKGKSVRESQHLTKEGDAIPLEVSARSFKYNGRRTILSIGRDVRERRKLEQQILNISEQERQRIGQDMHDDLGQMLTGIGLIAQNLARKLDSQGSEWADQVEEIADMVKEADEHARALSRGLVPVNIESNGLDNALQELIKKSEKMYDIDIHFSNDQNIELKDNSSAVHLYRIAQEAINNAIKHGKPTTIDVELNVEDEYATLSVEDNGSGFPESKANGDGMGVRIMNFRAQMIGGNLEINSATGSGTEIICRMPLANN